MLQNSSNKTLAPPPAEFLGNPVASAQWQPLNSNLSPAEMAAQLIHLEGFVWLDSAVVEVGSVSLLAFQPTRIFSGQIDRDWPEIESVLGKGAADGSAGGLFGWVDFDGYFRLGLYPSILKFDHDSSSWFQTGSFDLATLQDIQPPSGRNSLTFSPLVTRAEFVDRVKSAQGYIAAGDIYQVNLSHPWQAEWPAAACLFSFYDRLRRISPTPHAACLRLGDTAVMSASPELFLKMSGRNITTRPIKGTRPRFPDDPHRDAQSARDLLACDKERAELLMITDLERNDLGQVCEFGSVQTPDLWRVESFAQVYHLVSTVTGTLRSDISHAAAFRACFPGGSISGAPKKRALEIISELESHPRGLYTGAIGYFGFDGTSQWNIAIRTAVQNKDHISFHVGSGIVADSIPEREWEETLHKASGLLQAWA